VAAQDATGSRNVDIGYQTGYTRGAGNDNVNIGWRASGNTARPNPGTSNVYIGKEAGYGANSQTSNGANVGVGERALYAVTTGNTNTAIGYYALNALTSGNGNIEINAWQPTGSGITTGNYNISIGDRAALPSASGSQQSNFGNVMLSNGNGSTVINGSGAPTSWIGALPTIKTSAAFEISSTTRGFLPPQMTTSQINAVASPATALQMYDTDRAKQATYDGVAWSYNEVLNMKIHKALGSPVKAWTADIYTATSTTALVDGQMQYQAFYIDEKATLTGVKYVLNQAGNFTGDNTNSISLFSYSAGTLTKIAETANDENIFKATANLLQTVNFASTVAVNPGVYYIGLLYNSSAQTTAPSFRSPLSMGVLTFNSLDYTNSAKLNGAVSATNSPPASIAASAISTSNSRYLVGVF
jgi:hypothetical protein